jgi:hypothetical protein
MLKRVDPTGLKDLYAKYGLGWKRKHVGSEGACCVLGILLLEAGLPRTNSVDGIVELSVRGWSFDYLMGLWQGFDDFEPDEENQGSDEENAGYKDGVNCWKELNDAGIR